MFSVTMIKKVKYLFTLITLFSFIGIISCDFKSKDIKKEGSFVEKLQRELKGRKGRTEA